MPVNNWIHANFIQCTADLTNSGKQAGWYCYLTFAYTLVILWKQNAIHAPLSLLVVPLPPAFKSGTHRLGADTARERCLQRLPLSLLWNSPYILLRQHNWNCVMQLCPYKYRLQCTEFHWWHKCTTQQPKAGSKLKNQFLFNFSSFEGAVVWWSIKAYVFFSK